MEGFFLEAYHRLLWIEFITTRPPPFSQCGNVRICQTISIFYVKSILIHQIKTYQHQDWFHAKSEGQKSEKFSTLCITDVILKVNHSPNSTVIMASLKRKLYYLFGFQSKNTKVTLLRKNCCNLGKKDCCMSASLSFGFSC